MADVKWIKITTDIFDDEKILLIESLPDAYAIITCWFKLLCLAGKQNNSGVFVMSNSIPYTDTMLATVFRMKETTVKLALETFEQFGMVEIVNGIITIPNWNKHQSLDAIEKKREYQKELMRKRRAEQKVLCDTNSYANSYANVSHLEGEREEEGEEEIEGDKNKKESIDYQHFADLFNTMCPSFPSVKTMSSERRKRLKARLNTYTEDDFVILFSKAEASNFLKGKNKRDWSATFDWLIKDDNMAKVLEGNYDDKPKATQEDKMQEAFDMMDRWAMRGDE